jgi:pre-mRNA-splicing factor CDC5/CEF1
MVRILIKGGVWKNTEDEILKAAVMKYGKNQWARVASLLNRKTAGQCKARWYEWLDPSIKKTEWSKEEEEKLLHLAKLMPNQWRTIAPIVGRTAGQCMEHYERLLDQAQEGAAEGDLDDPRRLKAGEIDPTPETKPARPDPIDMDEDEKEMLSEARARLANTMGKKAKRKARERQLEEAKRLSIVQKRRELKAAGIESKIGLSYNRKGINYAKEIPFQKAVPAGFYDVGEEIQRGKAQVLDAGRHGLELSRLEGRHAKEEEEREKQKEAKRLKQLFKANAPEAIAKISAINDPTALHRRVALNLPSPQVRFAVCCYSRVSLFLMPFDVQVSDTELEQIVKISQTNAGLMPPPEGSMRATQMLIGDYSNLGPSLDRSTPQRTPLQEDVIMQEARNLRRLREMTPLLDSQSDAELPELYEGTGFHGVKPRSGVSATPNTVLGTPLLLGAKGSDSVSGSQWKAGGSVAHSVSSTPLLRDQLGLNSGAFDNISETASVVSESMSSVSSRAREKQLKSFLAAQLKSLPEPEYTYDIAVPDVAPAEHEESSVMAMKPEDAADVIMRNEQQRADEERREQERRSAVIRRRLPRPAEVIPAASMAEQVAKPNAVITPQTDSIRAASALINQEMVRMLAQDAYKFPTGKAAQRPAQVNLPVIDDLLLKSARELIAAEVPKVQWELFGGEVSAEVFSSAWEDEYKQLTYVPADGAAGFASFQPATSLSKPQV